MGTHISSLFPFSQQAKIFAKTFLQVILGSFFLALCSKVSIPLYPVPITFQTLGVFLLAIMMGGRHAALAGFFYLLQLTIGFPIKASGISDPLWMIGPTAGYLFGFPIAAYVTGTLADKKKGSSLWIMFSIFCGQLVIYSLGGLFLSRFGSFKMAIHAGVLPFLLLDGFKIVFASFISGLYLSFNKKNSIC